MLRVGIVAGEDSGDVLGADLMRSIKSLLGADAVEFVGIAGPRMQAEGCESLYDISELSLMGLVEVLAHLPKVLGMRRHLTRYFHDHRPDVFVGIDAPDFNLGLERKLRQSGIPTVQYVGPNVWAWRQYRLKKIAHSTDMMMTLFPFEPPIYAKYGIEACFVGHPMANRVALVPDRGSARDRLGVSADDALIALLPGSRRSEAERLGTLFLDTAAWCYARRPHLRFVIPMANARTRSVLEQQIAERDDHLPLMLMDGGAHDAMLAADVTLLASGTAALEAMLLKTPMVVAYRMAWLTHQIVKRLVKVPFVSLANVLAGYELVPELLQDQAKPEILGGALLDYLDDEPRVASLRATYRDLHQKIMSEDGDLAAKTVIDIARRSDLS